jgi:hypothetical protein
MRIARLELRKHDTFDDIYFQYNTWPKERFGDKFIIHVLPYFYLSKKQTMLFIRQHHPEFWDIYNTWDAAFIAKALHEASTHSLTKEEIYPSSLKNKHILTVKQSIYYAWRNIKQSAKRLLKHKKWPFFKYTTKLWMGS